MNESIGTGRWPTSGSSAVAAQNSKRVLPGRGPAMLEAAGVDLRYMPSGILVRQVSIGSPKIRTDSPRATNCDAVANPYGPAPITTASIRCLRVGEVLLLRTIACSEERVAPAIRSLRISLEYAGIDFSEGKLRE